MCAGTYPPHCWNKTRQSPGRDQTLKVLFRPRAGGQSVGLRHGGDCGVGSGGAMTERPGLSGSRCGLGAGQGRTFLSDT